MGLPRVEIVVPVYNGELHLEACLKSIASQDYGNWRATVLNNCSTDCTGIIADEFAVRDGRFCVIHCKEFVGQGENYNRAVEHVLPDADYVKIVEADNLITRDAVSKMVEVAQRDAGIGIVGSYWVLGKSVAGSGVDYSVEILLGAEVVRLLFLENRYILGSPTNLLYRADLLREERLLFPPDLFYDDADLCFRLLRKCKFGYVHQVLAFQRDDNNGVSCKWAEFDYVETYQFFLLKDYGEDFLNQVELTRVQTRVREAYLARLAHAVVARKPKEYWRFHEHVYRKRGEAFSRSILIWPVFRELVDVMLNPKSTLERLIGGRRDLKVRRTGSG